MLEAVVDHEVLPLGPARDHVRYPQSGCGRLVGLLGRHPGTLGLLGYLGYLQPQVGPDPRVGGPGVRQDAAAGSQGAELDLPPGGRRDAGGGDEGAGGRGGGAAGLGPRAVLEEDHLLPSRRRVRWRRGRAVLKKRKKKQENGNFSWCFYSYIK